MNLRILQSFFYNTALLITGGAICALSVNGILIPREFLSSGMTGVTLIIFYKYPVLPVGALYLLVNIPVFAMGWFFVGLRFVLYSLWGMFLFSVMLALLNYNMTTGDDMLNAVISGGMNGIGVAIMMRSFGSAGGSEILCVIMNKFFYITLGTGAVIINAIVLLISSRMYPLDKVLYTLVYIVVSTRATDIIFHGLSQRQAVFIVSDRWREIVAELKGKHKIGLTLLSGQGGYRGTEKKVLYSVINRRTVSPVKKAVIEKDPSAFIAIMGASDVTGVEVGNQPHW